MLGQGAAEVIVVDYSCPDNTAAHVAENFPDTRVVKVENEEYFSNWRGRNEGAAAATSDLLVFCDADTILAPGALDWIDQHLPPQSYGYFKRWATNDFNREGIRLAGNQLKGFQVIPAPAFRRVRGYDQVFEGYASGADTDLEDRLMLSGVKQFVLDPAIIERVIEHGDEARTSHHRNSIRVSYAAGLVYRKAKWAVLMVHRVPELPLDTRRKIYASAEAGAKALAAKSNKLNLSVTLAEEPVRMPRAMGFERGALKLSVVVEISGTNRLDETSD
jgi:hypothetical protein